MISFFAPTDAYFEPFSREHPTRQPDQQRSRQQQEQLQDFALPFDCLRMCAAQFAHSDSDDMPAYLAAHEAMQSADWGSLAHPTAKPARHQQHQRQSSLSSLNSAGPASPFTTHMPHPQVAVTDPAVDGFTDLHPHDLPTSQAGGFSQFSKPENPYLECHSFEATVQDKMAYPVTIPGPTQKQRADRSLLPAPDFSNTGNQSPPASFTSSVTGDSPATPTVAESDRVDRRRTDYCNPPKLDRTMTDVYEDELYSPNFAITSTTSPSQSQTLTSPTNDVFNQRINAANSQHLSAAHSPSSTASRTRSPFRNGSPFVSSSIAHGSLAVLNSTMRKMKERTKAQELATSTQRHADGRAKVEASAETLKTISPKDAILEFSETEGNANFPLFPQEASTFILDSDTKPADDTEPDDALAATKSFRCAGAPSTVAASFLPSQMPPSAMRTPQQYPYATDLHIIQHTPPHPSLSMSSPTASCGSTPTSLLKPIGIGADGGTYTCTYHGCTLRFETPSMLQKHKREGHRQTQGLGGLREATIPSTLINTQSGPHRCDRINPSTGKPCSTVFSRPYDLTRHEDTIHNARKQKVRCDMCTEEKTFSRADALTRHYRVCHPEVELPGKHRRQGSV